MAVLHDLEADRDRAAEAQRAIVRSLAAALEARDGYTGGHSETVHQLALSVARRLGLSRDAVEHVASVSLLHDIGKIGIPDAILHKPGPLDAGERAIMREHPAIGERILLPLPGMEEVARAVRHEHERWDGRGYPDGLAGEAIPLAVADRARLRHLRRDGLRPPLPPVAPRGRGPQGARGRRRPPARPGRRRGAAGLPRPPGRRARRPGAGPGRRAHGGRAAGADGRRHGGHRRAPARGGRRDRRRRGAGGARRLEPVDLALGARPRGAAHADQRRRPRRGRGAPPGGRGVPHVGLPGPRRARAPSPPAPRERRRPGGGPGRGRAPALARQGRVAGGPDRLRRGRVGRAVRHAGRGPPRLRRPRPALPAGDRRPDRGRGRPRGGVRPPGRARLLRPADRAREPARLRGAPRAGGRGRGGVRARRRPDRRRPRRPQGDQRHGRARRRRRRAGRGGRRAGPRGGTPPRRVRGAAERRRVRDRPAPLRAVARGGARPAGAGGDRARDDVLRGRHAADGRRHARPTCCARPTPRSTTPSAAGGGRS